MCQRLTLTFLIIALLNSIVVKSYVQSASLNDLKIHSPSRKIDSGLRKHVWNVVSDNSLGSKEKRNYYDTHEKEMRSYFGRTKRGLICARNAAMPERKKRRLNHHYLRHEIEASSEKENIGAQIEKALLCNYERVRRELKKINVTLAPKDELETNFQIIIDSELAKAILERLAILSSPKNSEKETTTSIAMTVKDNDKEVGESEEHGNEADIMNENETETEAEEENEMEEDSDTATEDNLPEDAEGSITLSPVEEEEELSSLPSTGTITTEERVNDNNTTEKEIDDNSGNFFTCNFTAYQEMKWQCKGIDDDETGEGDGLPCSMIGLWVSNAGGVQLDIKAGSSKGYLDVLVHNLTPPRKGFLSTSWKIVGQLPFLDVDGNAKTSEESMIEDSLGGIFSLTATVPGASSDTTDKQLAIFIGECRVCEGDKDTIVGTWSLKQPSKNCRDAFLSLQEIRDVLHRDILSESIKSKSKRMADYGESRGHKRRLHRNIFRRHN